MSAIVVRWFVPLSIALIAVLLVGVFRLKEEAGVTRASVNDLKAEVSAERDAQAVLRAETQYLARPARTDAANAVTDPLGPSPLAPSPNSPAIPAE